MKVEGGDDEGRALGVEERAQHWTQIVIRKSPPMNENRLQKCWTSEDPLPYPPVDWKVPRSSVMGRSLSPGVSGEGVVGTACTVICTGWAPLCSG